MTTDMIQRQTITVICENVAQAQADIAQAFSLLQGAKERLTATLMPRRRLLTRNWEKPADCTMPRFKNGGMRTRGAGCRSTTTTRRTS